MSLKVLFITGQLKHYRIPILNRIVEMSKFDLTVAHGGKKISLGPDLFKETILNEKKIGPFTIHKRGLYDYCNDFDVVVCMLYLQKLSFMQLLLQRSRSFKLIYWGIGVKASQNSKFDSPTFLNNIRYIIAKKCDAMIFYTDYARDKYILNGVKAEKLFVMNNTVEVKHLISETFQKQTILFVGTLNKSKKIFYLLEAYKKAFSKCDKMPNLDIVGEGLDFANVKLWVKNNKISNKVKIHGAIYNPKELEKLYKKALVSISPGQAGLSVLSSFGYGVPFITHKDAITGGERLNIESNYNGLIIDNYSELDNILIEIANNKDKYIEMGINSRKFYLNKRSPKIMAQGFIDAVNFTLN